MFSGWERAPKGGWQKVPKPLHSWGDFKTDVEGRIQLWRSSPLAGTYAGIDGYGLLWSGRLVEGNNDAVPAGLDVSSLKENHSLVIVTRGAETIVSQPLTSAKPQGLRQQYLERGRLNGAYAAPADGMRHPAIILLHGSEGGSRDGAQELAQRFAARGYAAFALNYFAWDLAGLRGVPNAHVNQPLELLSTVRDWLAKQPEADVTRIGLYGHSKGAEYAEVAAVRFPWVKAVAACVPTDAVWQGYGIGDERNRTNAWGKTPLKYSSFSWKGQPLPYIPLDGSRDGFHSNTLYYESKRAERPATAKTAAIAVEKSRAAFLWLGGGRDETWASGAMAQRLDARLRATGASNRSELRLYDRAGHAICGDGTYPTRLWVGDSTDPRDPDRDADGRATVDGWQRIVAFFNRTLKDPDRMRK